MTPVLRDVEEPHEHGGVLHYFRETLQHLCPFWAVWNMYHSIDSPHHLACELTRKPERHVENLRPEYIGSGATRWRLSCVLGHLARSHAATRRARIWAFEDLIDDYVLLWPDDEIVGILQSRYYGS